MEGQGTELLNWCLTQVDLFKSTNSNAGCTCSRSGKRTQTRTYPSSTSECQGGFWSLKCSPEQPNSATVQFIGMELYAQQMAEFPIETFLSLTEIVQLKTGFGAFWPTPGKKHDNSNVLWWMRPTSLQLCLIEIVGKTMARHTCSF